MTNVCVIGKSGQLANELVHTAPDGLDVFSLGRKDLDILSKDEIRDKFTELSPEIVINASAYTAVDRAESDRDAAYAINCDAVSNLAEISRELNIRFIHISTDFVFSGENNEPYCVDENTKPTSIYGASKEAGERAILSVYPENSTIVRTSWVYSEFGNNFVKTMLKLMAEKEELSVVGDQIGRPTYARDLARFLWKLSGESNICSIYHWSDDGCASWFDFAKAIQELAFEKNLLKVKIPVKSIRTVDYPTPAKRPKYSVLNIEGSRSVMEARYWRDGLAECLERM